MSPVWVIFPKILDGFLRTRIWFCSEGLITLESKLLLVRDFDGIKFVERRSIYMQFSQRLFVVIYWFEP